MVAEKTPSGYLARSHPGLSVLVLHEAYGLYSPTSNVPEVCDRLASAGFQALAPDLYGGAGAHRLEDALTLMRALRPEEALGAIKAAVEILRRHRAQRVVVLGFCMGGALSFRSALEVDSLCGAVVFYGTPRGNFSRLGVPVLGHFALRDAFVDVDQVRTAERQLIQAGKRITFHYYEADHAFMNEKLPAYEAQSAALAWERTLQFLLELRPAEQKSRPPSPRRRA
jgi:carboxymethylenebutenolidase